MQKMVQLIPWHVIIQAARQEISPITILVTHMFMLRRMIFLLGLEKALWEAVSKVQNTE
jgi:hypothetical protein